MRLAKSVAGPWIRSAVVLVALTAAAHGEPKDIIPWDKLGAEERTELRAIVDTPTFYHRTRSEVFACDPALYLSLLHDPITTLEIWKAIGLTKGELKKVGPDRYEGSDGVSSEGHWQFLHKTPELNVILVQGQYTSPLLRRKIRSKSVLIVRSVFFKEQDDKIYVKHQLDGYVKVVSGLGPITQALVPIYERSVQKVMQEALWFVSLMCRYAVHDPHAVAKALADAERVPAESRARVEQLLEPLLAGTPPRPPQPRRTLRN